MDKVSQPPSPSHGIETQALYEPSTALHRHPDGRESRRGPDRGLVGVEAEDVAVGILEPGGSHGARLGHMEIALLT